MATTARSITSDIRWLLQDDRLDRHPDFKVQTKRIGGGFETVIHNVDANGAREALVAYAANTPGIDIRVHGRQLRITQPAR